MSKSAQKMKFTWKGIKQSEQRFKEFKKRTLGKLDMNASKQTYIDDIIRDNTRKKYPIPGPGSHFLDEKLVQKWHGRRRGLFSLPKKDFSKKNNFGLAKRIFGDKNKAKIPAPGHCQPDVTSFLRYQLKFY